MKDKLKIYVVWKTISNLPSPDFAALKNLPYSELRRTTTALQ